jgi:predicted transcriptional regulator
MRARELSEPYPTVGLDSQAVEAAQAMAGQRLPGLIVCDREGHPYTVLPGSQVLRFLIPRYVQDDPALARVFGEKASDAMWGKLSSSTVRDVLPPKQHVDELPIVDGDATTIEVAAVMARMHSPVVAVVEGGEVLGAITVSRLLAHLVPEAPTSP